MEQLFPCRMIKYSSLYFRFNLNTLLFLAFLALLVFFSFSLAGVRTQFCNIPILQFCNNERVISFCDIFPHKTEITSLLFTASYEVKSILCATSTFIKSNKKIRLYILGSLADISIFTIKHMMRFWNSSTSCQNITKSRIMTDAVQAAALSIEDA